MKKNIVFILLFLPVLLFCQTKDTAKQDKIQIGIIGSADYCYRSLKADAASKWISDMRDTLEIPKLGYTLGISCLYEINKNIKIDVALLYSESGEKTKKYLLDNNNDIRLPSNNTFIYKYRYLDIPLKVNYYFLNKKLKLYATAGVSANVFLSKKTTSILEYSNFDTEKSKSVSSTGFSKINFAVLAGAGFNYSVSNKLDIKVEPIYRRSITSIINAPIKEYLYSTGLNFGIYYNL
jgi:opacity protein-like surface antigen